MKNCFQRLKEVNLVALYGYGREGKSTEQFLKKNYQNLKIDVWEDDQNGHPQSDEANRELHAYPIIIKSPGISFYKPQLKGLEDKITSNLEIWLDWNRQQKNPAKTIVVSGTKGKSTTSSLIHFALTKLGHTSRLVGNIGTPALEHTNTTEFVVIEASSYQLTNLTGKIDWGLFLNLTPEHQDWHKTHSQYYEDKTKFFRSQNPARIYINSESPLLENYFSQDFKRFNLKKNWHYNHKGVFYNKKCLIPTEKIPLLGPHNRSNLAGVLAIITQASANKTNLKNDLFQDFTALPHRLEKIKNQHKQVFYNDSISTTPMATLAALESIWPQKVILIMGGQDRGQDYSDFAKQLKPEQIRSIFCIPQNGEEIQKMIQKFQPAIDIQLTPNLELAVQKIKETLKKDQVVIFSPGAPSYGLYKNFEARGIAFRSLIN